MLFGGGRVDRILIIIIGGANRVRPSVGLCDLGLSVAAAFGVVALGDEHSFP